MIWIIPTEAWRKNRDRLVQRTLRSAHLNTDNRREYVFTRAELVRVVEDVMEETERLGIFYARGNK